MAYPQSLEVYAGLQEGDRVEVTHEVKVGFRKWISVTKGKVLKKDRSSTKAAAEQPADAASGEAKAE